MLLSTHLGYVGKIGSYILLKKYIYIEAKRSLVVIQLIPYLKSAYYRSRSVTWSAALKIAWNKRKRTQQLPTLLRQQCWELLRACWQWCVNGCNNSQQSWNLQCIVGRIQPISLCKPWVMSVRGPNNVG